jgi:hypothetical protein
MNARPHLVLAILFFGGQFSFVAAFCCDEMRDVAAILRWR